MTRNARILVALGLLFWIWPISRPKPIRATPPVPFPTPVPQTTPAPR